MRAATKCCCPLPCKGGQLVLDDKLALQPGVNMCVGTFLRGMALAKASVVGLDVVLPSRSFDSVLPGSDAKLLGGLVAARPLVPVVLGTSADDTGQPLPIYGPSSPWRARAAPVRSCWRPTPTT
ncbi:hypothetical protein [Candidatus Aalborgicola defluviihabitans]|uniref:hypothetical protein n=1 Tax=Candidatus Aalborgicola defluviihabitans TaxID=3386187 RepID=UPI001ECE7F4C|nr:hypothetical protein [Burkholderiales bacterium]